MLPQSVQNDWDKSVLCASSRRGTQIAWNFESERFNKIRDAMASTKHSSIWYHFHYVSRPDSSPQEKLFTRLSQEWRNQTGHLSSIERKAMHPAYQEIIGMGVEGVPYVLRDLKEHGGHWFWALHFMTGLDLSRPNQTREELQIEWLEWGRNQGYDGL